jgi:cell shape-determining protein MreC
MRNVFATLLLFISLISWATEPEQKKPSLQEQFQEIRSNSEFIDPFRMVRAYQVENFWKAVQDTLREKDEAMAMAQQKISSVENEVKALKNTIREKDASVEEMAFAGAHISFLGWDVPKARFIWIAISVTVVLIVLMAMLFLAFRTALRAARESRDLYNEVSNEFDTYKRNTVEKEVKLYRELQDYRNRLTELKTA